MGIRSGGGRVVAPEVNVGGSAGILLMQSEINVLPRTGKRQRFYIKKIIIKINPVRFARHPFFF